MRVPTQPSYCALAAFTLVELMVVIVLVGIMSALILPEMAGTYADAKLKSTARRLITLCSFANSQAISHSQTQRIRFDQAARRYRLESGSPTPPSSRPGRSTAGGIETEGEWDPSIRLRIQEQSSESSAGPANPRDLARSSPLPEAASKADTTALIFYADGTALARQVTLEDQGGFRVVLEINGTTSRVRIAATERP